MIYFVTDRGELSEEEWLRCMVKRMEEDVDFMIIRDKGKFSPKLVRQLMTYKIAHKELKTKVLVHSDLALAKAVYADGVHLPYSLWKQYRQEKDGLLENWGKDKVVGVSTHQAEEVKEAEGKVSYMFLSPVFRPSCKDVEGKGVSWFKSLKKEVKTPLVALGGITPENVDLLYKEGIHDIAVMSYLMLASNSLDKLRKGTCSK